MLTNVWLGVIKKSCGTNVLEKYMSFEHLVSDKSEKLDSVNAVGIMKSYKVCSFIHGS